MIRRRIPVLALALTLTLASIAGAAAANQVSGVGEGIGSTRISACRSAIQQSSAAASVAASNAQRTVDARIFLTVEVSACECEQSTTSSQTWTCIAPWRLVAMPVERH